MEIGFILTSTTFFLKNVKEGDKNVGYRGITLISTGTGKEDIQVAKNKGSLLVYTIIGLAIIGVITQLFGNTASFLTNILTMLGIGVAVFALIYFLVLRKPNTTNDAKKYKQAVKQSKAKYNQQENKPNTSSKPSQSAPVKKKPNKRASHLRVIDGNGHKSKRKNRASF